MDALKCHLPDRAASAALRQRLCDAPPTATGNLVEGDRRVDDQRPFGRNALQQAPQIPRCVPAMETDRAVLQLGRGVYQLAVALHVLGPDQSPQPEQFVPVGEIDWRSGRSSGSGRRWRPRRSGPAAPLPRGKPGRKREANKCSAARPGSGCGGWRSTLRPARGVRGRTPGTTRKQGLAAAQGPRGPGSARPAGARPPAGAGTAPPRTACSAPAAPPSGAPRAPAVRHLRPRPRRVPRISASRGPALRRVRSARTRR